MEEERAALSLSPLLLARDPLPEGACVQPPWDAIEMAVAWCANVN